ncbi:hypothetical protein VP168E361_P0058 [Vibrio phage 168E36-1]|nr:hypothetical protein VP168E361_P0058 [Vibrio phage 168E36-1]
MAIATGLWSQREEEILSTNADKSIKTLETLIHRSRKSIRDKAYRMGVTLTGEVCKRKTAVDSASHQRVVMSLKAGVSISQTSRDTGVSYGYCHKVSSELHEEANPSMTASETNSLLNSVFGQSL